MKVEDIHILKYANKTIYFTIFSETKLFAKIMSKYSEIFLLYAPK